MLKRILFALVEFAAFCALFFVGGYWAWVRLTLEMRAMQKGTAAPPLIPLWTLHINPQLDYVANGLIFATALLVVIVLAQAIRRKLGTPTAWTLAAFVLAFLLSVLFRSGFVPLTPAS